MSIKDNIKTGFHRIGIIGVVVGVIFAGGFIVSTILGHSTLFEGSLEFGLSLLAGAAFYMMMWTVSWVITGFMGD